MKNKLFKKNQTNASFLEHNSYPIRLIREGKSVKDVANELGMTNQNLYSIIQKYEKIESEVNSNNFFACLSTRAINCLRAEDINTTQKIKTAIDSGRINKIPNLGATTIAEINDCIEKLPPDSFNDEVLF